MSKRNNRVSLGRVLPALVLALVFSAVIVFVGIDTRKKNKVYADKQQQLEEELKAENDRTNEIEEYRIYVTTDEYKKDVLRERFNYADKNEIVFRFSD